MRVFIHLYTCNHLCSNVCMSCISLYVGCAYAWYISVLDVSLSSCFLHVVKESCLQLSKITPELSIDKKVITPSRGLLTEKTHLPMPWLGRLDSVNVMFICPMVRACALFADIRKKEGRKGKKEKRKKERKLRFLSLYPSRINAWKCINWI